MALDPKELARYRAEYDRYAEAMGDTVDEPSPLETTAEMIGYLTAVARAGGDDEADVAELFVRLSNLDRASIREARAILKPLGYLAVCDRLKVLARSAPAAPAWVLANEEARARRREAHLRAHAEWRRRKGL